MNPAVVGIFVPIVGSIMLFGFLSISVWVDGQRKEREAFYKAETLRRITETSGEGAKAAMDLLKEEERLKRIKSREGVKIGGVVNLGAGIGLTIFLWALAGPTIALCGLIPGFIGVALLVYAFKMAGPVE